MVTCFGVGALRWTARFAVPPVSWTVPELTSVTMLDEMAMPPEPLFWMKLDVLLVMLGLPMKPFASVSGVVRLFWTRRLFESGDC